MAFDLHALSDGEVYNLGTGIGTPFRWLVETALDVAGRTAKVVADPSKPEGVFCRYADTSKAGELGVRAAIPLREGIRRWLEANG